MPKLILDTNVLAVFVIGRVDPNLLGVAKRFKEYRPSDFEILYTYLSLFNEIIILPNIISEVSNLIRYLKGERRQACMEVLASLALSGSERYIPSDSAARQPEYITLGITDAAILCALGEDTYLLTADRELQLAAICRSHEVQHFEDLRAE